jgi:hypothetical protein
MTRILSTTNGSPSDKGHNRGSTGRRQNPQAYLRVLLARLAEAVGYALNQWAQLTVFGRDDVDPQRYLTQLLANLPNTPTSQLGQWLPDNWDGRPATARSAEEIVRGHAPVGSGADARRQAVPGAFPRGASAGAARTGGGRSVILMPHGRQQ